jgi:hypothetical protein
MSGTTPEQDPRSRLQSASTVGAPKATKATTSTAGLPKDRSMFDQLRNAAEAQYRNEMDMLKMSGLYGTAASPNPQRILERYNNAIRGIAAQERMAGRQELYKNRIRERVADRKAGKAETEALAGKFNAENEGRFTSANLTGGVDAAEQKNREYLDKLVREYTPRPTTPEPSIPYSNPEDVGPPAPTNLGAMAEQIREMIEETPTGQLSQVATPDIARRSPGVSAEDRATYGLGKNLDELLATLPPDQRAAVEQQMAQRQMVEEAGRVGFDPTGYAELNNRSSGEKLLRGANTGFDRFMRDLYNSPVAAPFRPGTGVLGAPLPAELAQREVDRARTPEERAAAEARQTQAQMQGALQDLLGGAAAGIRGPAGPAPAPVRAQPVVDNPMLQGQTAPTTERVNPVQVSPGFERGMKFNPRQRIPGMGDFYTPQATTQVNPGQPGQVVDMPVPQGTARTNPYSGGLPEAIVPTTGPMGTRVRDVDPLAGLVPSATPVGSARPPYPATVATPTGQRLLPGYTEVNVPSAAPATPNRGIMEPRTPAPTGDIPGQGRMFENLEIPTQKSSPVPIPVAPRQIREEQETARRVAQGRAANAQIARQMAAKAPIPVDPVIQQAVDAALKKLIGGADRFADATVRGTNRLANATKRGAKGVVEGYKSARDEAKKKAAK